MPERSFKLNLIMIIYLFGAIGLICFVMIAWTTNIDDNLIMKMFFPSGVFIGDVTVPINLIIVAVNYIFGPLFLVTGILTLPAVYSIYQLKDWGWKYTLLISMLWTLFLIGLIIVWIFLNDEIKNLF